MFSIIQAAGWPIWPLIACSILALAVVMDRFMNLKKKKIAPDGLLEEVIALTRAGVPSAQVIAQLQASCALGDILASGLRTLHASPHCDENDLRASMEDCGRVNAQRLEKHLSTLATIASTAPLLGLFGTVVGMIEIFGYQSGASGAAANPAQLAHGISVALYNTAFGLVVAIPSLIFWRFFRARVDAHLLALELGADRLVRHLKSLRH